MLVAVGMVAGTVNSWGQETTSKKVLFTTDFESGQASDYWTQGNGYLVTPTASGSTGKCASIKQSKDRGDYLLTKADYTNIKNYTIEFDFLLNKGSKDAQFALMSESAWSSWVVNYGYFWKTNSTQEHNPYLLFMNIPANGTTATFNEKSNETYSFSSGKWYHFTVNIDSDKRTTSYAINVKGSKDIVASGDYTLPEEESTNCKGFYERNNRYNYDPGAICIDNIDIYTMVTGKVANVPTITLTKVNGKERTYTITYTDGETLHYMLPGETEYTEVSTGNYIEVTTSESGELVAYTTNGESQSANVTETVDASEIALNVPTSALTNLGEGYEKEYTISIDNSNILLTPTASLSYVFTSKDGNASDAINISNGGKIKMSEAGTYVITASAEGYTSSSITIKNDIAYTATNEFDFAGMTADDFADTNMWKQGEDTDNRWGWSTSNPCTKFELQNVSENANTAIKGINLFTNRVPTFYIGKGLMVPYGGSNYGPITLQNTQKGQMAVYTYLNNYGKNTLVTVQSADAVYNLYRYSDMLTNIKVYSPTDMLTAKVGNAMYATYVTVSKTTVPTNIKTYAVKANAEKTGIELSEIAAGTVIPANTALLLHAAEGTYNFTVSTEDAATIENNALVPATTDVTATGNEYALTKQNGKVGFAQVEAGVVIPAGKAYLVVDNSDESAAKFFSFDNGEVTGINNVNTVDADNNAYYTLQGLKTQKPVKGMYIHNGKKVILK